jgi:SAM-dependent methyltransferase
MSVDLEAVKAAQRTMWSTGDYPDIARSIEVVAEVLVQSGGIQPGERVLDVATGSGNVAIVAASRGASVSGLDLTPALLDAARERAAQAGLEVEWLEGDAESLPFPDASFDRVTSCFGVMFAPRHGVAASELARVARPGATIAVTAWTPEGLNGRMFKTVGSFMPAPPPELEPPISWGVEEHVRSLLEPAGAELEFERRSVTFVHDSPESWVEYNTRVLGPAILARAALEPQGRWEDLRGELLELYRECNEADDGTLRLRAEYLIAVARMPS